MNATQNADAGWGAYAPSGLTRQVLRLCSALPANHWAFYSLTKAFRTFIKRGAVRFYDVEAHGLRLRLLNRGNYSDTKLLFSPQFYDREELDWLCDELAHGGTFLDIGGNIGAYSLIIAERMGSRVSVHTVEPDTELSKRMLFNADENHLQIKLHSTALSDYEGDGHIVLSTRQSGQNTFAQDANGPGTSVTVPVTTLLNLCRKASIDRIRALKIDIEGHEHKVLARFFEDAEESLWPRAIVIEKTEDRAGIINKLIDELQYSMVSSTKRNMLLRR